MRPWLGQIRNATMMRSVTTRIHNPQTWIQGMIQRALKGSVVINTEDMQMFLVLLLYEENWITDVL